MDRNRVARVVACALLLVGPASADWPNYGGSAAHTFSSGGSGVGTGAMLWNFTGLGTAEAASPVADGGVVFWAGWGSMMQDSGRVVALDAGTGAVRWQADAPGAYVFSGTPIVAGGRIAVPGRNLTALAVEDGRLLWNVPSPGGFPRGLAATNDRLLESGTLADSKMTLRDWASGAIVANGSTRAHALATIVPDAIVATTQGHAGQGLVGLDPNTLAPMWTQALPATLQEAPTVDGKRIYVGGWNDTLYAVDACAPALLWSHSFGGAQGTLGAVGTAAVANGLVYVAADSDFTSSYGFVHSEGHRVFALNPMDGHEVWNRSIEGSNPHLEYSGLAVGAHAVFVEVQADELPGGGRNASVEAFDATTGALLWRHDVADAIADRDPILVDGVLVAAFRMPGGHVLVGFDAGRTNHGALPSSALPPERAQPAAQGTSCLHREPSSGPTTSGHGLAGTAGVVAGVAALMLAWARRRR